MATENGESPSVFDEMQYFTNELRTRRDELMSPIYFQELLELAEETCLTTSPEYPEAAPATGEAAIIASIGSRGLKIALELDLGIIKEYSRSAPYESEEDEARAARQITLSSPIKFTKEFTPPTDLTVLAKAEAFGSRLMEESFRTLGQDAYEKADAFKNATTAEEQMEIIAWLDTRIRKMTEPADYVPATVDTVHYHPARISPKFIGVYPNTQVEPTCLSVSVIAAGFFRRAGVEKLLHADVSKNKTEQTAAYTLDMIHDLPENLSRHGLSFSDPVKASVDTITQQLTDYECRLEAHHSAVYVQLADATWAQFDTNFKATTHLIDPETNDKLMTSWEELRLLAPFAPNVELTSRFYDPYNYDFSTLARYVINEQEPGVTEALSAAATIELAKDTDEPLGERIYELIDSIFFNGDESQPEGLLGAINRTIKDAGVITYSGYKESHLRSVFYTLFHKYVLWGNAPTTVLEQAQSDASYAQNRVEDIASLPFLMAISLARDSFLDSVGEAVVHPVVELGLPEQRIGLAVLSDFAAHTNSPLSPSFWLSHWPGSVPIIENLDRASHSNFDDSLLYNNLVHREIHPLTSHRNYGIIRQFIEVREQAKQEGHDHGRTGQR